MTVNWEEVEVECCGFQLTQYLVKLHAKHDVTSDSAVEENEKESAVVIDLDLVYLKSLDPKEWRSQDHYAVLGLKNLRHKASSADIKSAYRQAVLCHHPDKRKAKGECVDQDSDYFTCITMAWETLGDPVKRRAYDSVDPTVDDALPPSHNYTDDQFFKVFGGAFARNSCWSEKQPVPVLGTWKTPRAQVESFYSFWYDFQSWREYSYEDEESKDKGQDRDERRWIEKQNRVVRAKKKKEEMTRIRSLVDSAYEIDPRIRRFRQEDKDRKEAVRKAKAQAAMERQAQADRARREEEEEKKRQKEEEEAEEKARQSLLKAEREAAKKNLRKEKKMLRDLCKANSYYSTEGGEEEARNMRYVELLCESLTIDDMKTFNTLLKDSGRQVFIEKVAEVEKKIEQERLNSLNSAKSRDRGLAGSDGCRDKWSDGQTALLIKAVNLFPAGTAQRWEVVANFINHHYKGSNQVSAKDVLSKAKEMQSNGDMNNTIKMAANKMAFENFEKQKKTGGKMDEVEVSRRMEEPWTCEEQRLLEQALKTYPASSSDRWDNIAAAVPSRSKKDCMRRYKELVEMVKAKKLAVQQTK